MSYPDGAPYRPSNGDEGLFFEAAFCNKCKHDQDWQDGDGTGCQILAMMLAFGKEDPQYPEEIQYKDGKGFCTAFEKYHD